MVLTTPIFKAKSNSGNLHRFHSGDLLVKRILQPTFVSKSQGFHKKKSFLGKYNKTQNKLEVFTMVTDFTLLGSLLGHTEEGILIAAEIKR